MIDLKRILAIVIAAFFFAAPAYAGLSGPQQARELQSSASRILGKCGNPRSPHRKCFSHVSAGQCRKAMKPMIQLCKRKTRRFLFPGGKSVEPSSTQRKAIHIYMRMCIGSKYLKKMMRNKSATKACLKKVRF